MEYRHVKNCPYLPTARKIKFFIKDFRKSVDLVTFTEEVLNGKLHFFSVSSIVFVEESLDDIYCR